MLPALLRRSARSFAALVALVAALALVAVLVVDGRSPAPVAAPTGSDVPAVVARATAPGMDFPRMPRVCATPKEKIPQEPGACFLNDFRAKRPTIVLWGDSHAWQHIPGLRLAVGKRNVNLVAFVMGTCPPMALRLPASGGTKCMQNAKAALDYIKRLDRQGRPLKVVLGAYWRYYLDVLAKPGAHDEYDRRQAVLFRDNTPGAFKALGRNRIDTDVLGQTVTVPEPAPCGKPYACKVPRAGALRQEQATATWVKNRMKVLVKSPRYISVNSKVCDAQWCYGRRDGVYTYYDPSHLTATRSRTMKPFFTGVVRDAIS